MSLGHGLKLLHARLAVGPLQSNLLFICSKLVLYNNDV